ncbi:MAG: carbohydrate-binding domain-containing protein [Roseiflexaceae bacterium]
MARHSYRLLTVLMLVSLLPWFSAAPAVAQEQPLPLIGTGTLPASPAAAAPARLTADPAPDRQLPSLVLRLTVTPDQVRVGDLVSAQLTVINQAPHPAEELTVTLPLPAGAAPVAGDAAFQGGGWRWALGTLASQSETSLAVTFRMAQRPRGDAVLLHPAATAKGLDLPVAARGGALVQPRSSEMRAQSAPEAVYTPGSPARFGDAEGQLSVELPASAFERPLRLRHTSEQERQAQPGVAQALPSDGRRGFSPFHLDAFDEAQQSIHRFRAPLTITQRFTPQQLAALGLDAATLSLFWLDEAKGAWVPIPTLVDEAAGTASASVDHFSTFRFADGSSPSSAFIPSLQGWQVGGFTGASSFSIPIEVPSGPGGVKPSLSLTYSSAATDGATGKRLQQQSSWVGKGWSLETGAVARNKIEVSSARVVEHFALTFGGRSYDLVRAEALVASPSEDNPTHWAWRPTDESFIRARAYTNGSSTSTRGGYDWGTPYTRHKWVVWDKDGTRYEFSDDAWWGWQACQGGSGDFAYMEAYKWLLTSVTDTRGNTISYGYGRNAKTFAETCFHVSGTIDVDVWPSSISWGNGRYQVTFETEARTNDTQVEWLPSTYGEPPRQTQRLKHIKVWSNPAGTRQLVRQYTLNHDYSLYSDARECFYEPDCATWGANTSFPKLTLKSVQRIASDGITALPAMTFAYNTNGGTVQRAAGGWNRLTSMSNGQGGVINFAYANISVATNNQLYDNHHRVTTRTVSDGRGNSYSWNYTYGTPAVNFLGTNLGDGLSTGPHPNSAALFYNKYSNALSNNEAWLVHPIWKEFRGHAWMQETAPDGAQTKHFYYQGDVGCTPAARDGDAAVRADPCFVQLRDREFLKGREYKTEVRGPSSAGSPLLSDTSTNFAVAFYDYTWAPLSGLWRAFSYESKTIQTEYEGSVASTKETEYYYNDSCTAGTVAAYGNLGCIIERDQTGALVRKTLRNYVARNDDPLTNQAASYLVDRLWGERVYDAAGNLLSLVHYWFDTTAALNTVGTRGEVRMERRYYNIPSGACCSGITLYGRDVVYEYDSFGNRTKEISYAGPGNTLGFTTSTPGAGSAARETLFEYDDPATTTVNEATSGLARKVTYPTLQPNSYRLTEQATYDYRMGTLTSITDLAGVRIQAEYDVHGRMVKLIKPGDTSAYPTLAATYYDTEQPFRYRYDQREQAGTANVRVNVKIYDGLGQLIQTKQESNGTAQSIVTDMRYDGLGRLRQQSQPRYVAETSTTYDRYTAVPASGVNWATTTYDALGRVATFTEPDGNQTVHRYGVLNDSTRLRLHDVTDPKRHRMQYRSDALGRLVGVIEITGNCPSPAYWGYTCGGAYTTPWAAGPTTTYSYSPLDLLTRVQDALGNVTTISYDSLGRKTQMTDPNMGTWYYTHDVNGNLVRQQDARGQRICFGYDALNRLTGKHFNGTSDTCPATPTSVTYGYDSGSYAGGKRTSMSGGGHSVNWVYDLRGRTQQANHTASGLTGTRSFTWGYDSADRVVSMGYPASGTLAAETLTYSYDPAWRQTSVCSSLGGCYAQGATYDALSQPARFTFGNGLVQSWSYSAPQQRLGRLQVGTSTTPGSMFDRSYSYDAAGNISAIVDNLNAQAQTFRYDERDRLTSSSSINTSASSITIRASGNNVDGWPVMRLMINGTAVREWSVASTTFADYTYTHTANIGPTDTVDVVYTNNYANATNDRNLYVDSITLGTQVVQAESRAVSYDLEAIDGKEVYASDGNMFWTGALRLTQKYSYNQIGNLTNKEGAAYTYGTTNAGPHQARTVAGDAYSYDANGNLLSGGGRSYVWNAENLPSSITSGGVTESYSYTGESARYKKVRGSVTTFYLQGSLEETAAGVVKRHYVLNERLVAVRERAAGATTTTVSYLHGDHLGSTSLATNGGAGVASRQEFDPWGKAKILRSAAPPYGSGGLPISQTSRAYTGQIQDDTGLLFYNARFYDPGLARFVSADSVVPGDASGSMGKTAYTPLTVDFHEDEFASGLAAENRGERTDVNAFGPSNAQALNRYSYVQNNPLKYTDPSGHLVYLSREEAYNFRYDVLMPLIEELQSKQASAEAIIGILLGGLALAGEAGDLVGEIAGLLGFAAAGGSLTGEIDWGGVGEVLDVLKYMDEALEGFLLGTDIDSDKQIWFDLTREQLINEAGLCDYGRPCVFTKYFINAGWETDYGSRKTKGRKQISARIFDGLRPALGNTDIVTTCDANGCITVTNP